MPVRFLLVLAVLLVASSGCSSTDGPVAADLPTRAGLAVGESDADVFDTIARIKGAITSAEGVSLVTEVNHDRNAQSASLTLGPTRVLIFGNPLVGTPLMQINQQAGLDLPQKMLVYEDEAGRTLVAYNTAAYLAARHSLEGSPALSTLTEALNGFLQTAIGEDGATKVTPPAGVSPGQGILTMVSDTTAGETYDRLREEIASNPNLEIFAEINHQFNAQAAGFQLRPTRLIIFGNADLGTPLMRASQTTAIDLPQKMLVYQAASGEVRVAYNDPAYLAERHAIPASTAEIAQIRTALDGLAEAATDRFGRRR